MRSFVILSALLVVVAQCGYPIPEYPTAPCYSIPSSYPTHTAPVPVSLPVVVAEESEESGFFEEGGHAASGFRKRAKARSAHNHKFQRRPLVPIRRFKLKKQ